MALKQTDLRKFTEVELNDILALCNKYISEVTEYNKYPVDDRVDLRSKYICVFIQNRIKDNLLAYSNTIYNTKLINLLQNDIHYHINKHCDNTYSTFNDIRRVVNKVYNNSIKSENMSFQLGYARLSYYSNLERLRFVKAWKVAITKAISIKQLNDYKTK